MIEAVDDTLRALFERDVLAGANVEVVFDAPTKEWAGRRNAPTVDAYLYDIREDLKRREYGRVDIKDDDGRVTERRRPPRYFKLSYLLTAWAQRPEDEHRMLAALLGCLLRHESLPRDLMAAPLGDLPYPIPLTVAQPPPDDRSISDVWTALGGELKATIDLTISVPFDLDAEVAAAVVTTPLDVDIHPDPRRPSAPAPQPTQPEPTAARRTRRPHRGAAP